MSRLRTGEAIAGLGGLAVLAGLVLLDWYGSDSGSISAWDGQGGLGTVANLLVLWAGLLGLVLVAAVLGGRGATLPAVIGAFTGFFGFVAVLCVVARMLFRPGTGPDLELGIAVTLIGSLACLVGAFVALRYESEPRGAADPDGAAG